MFSGFFHGSLFFTYWHRSLWSHPTLDAPEWARPGLECVGWTSGQWTSLWLTGWGSPFNEEVGKDSARWRTILGDFAYVPRSHIFLSFMSLWCWEVIGGSALLPPELPWFHLWLSIILLLPRWLPHGMFCSQPLVTLSLCFQFVFALQFSGESWSTQSPTGPCLPLLADGLPDLPGVSMHWMLSALYLLEM